MHAMNDAASALVLKAASLVSDLVQGPVDKLNHTF